MKQNILFKMLPMMAAAVLLATSCSKDSDGDSNVVSTSDNNVPEQEQVENLQPRTVPFTVTVSKDDSSLSKASVEKGDDNKLHQKFIVGDVLEITGGSGENTISGSLSLTEGDEGKTSDATFSGELTLNGTAELVVGTTKLTATLRNTVDATKNEGKPVSSIEPTTSSVKRASSLQEAFEKYGYLTAENFTYDGDGTQISLVQHTRFIAVNLPFSGAKITVKVNDGTEQTFYLSKECALAFPADVTVTVNSTTLGISNHTISKAVTWIRNRTTPASCISGLFSVAADKQVFFSKGNLMAETTDYGKTWKWMFHFPQYSYYGNNGANISIDGNGSVSVPNGVVDLFGWVGEHTAWTTEGAIHGICNSTTASEYGNVAGESLKSDWGKVFGEGSPWRTLTGGPSGEWEYLFNSRTTTSDIRYAKATVCGKEGVILLPDDWSTSAYSLNKTNTSDAAFTENSIDESTWGTLQAAGAVFLPAAGYRYGTGVDYVGYAGYYWSSTAYSTSFAFDLNFGGSNGVYPAGRGYRGSGQSVRLVRSL